MKELLESIKKSAKAKSFDKEKIIKQLMDLREYMKTQNDPLVVKVLRLTAEHIEVNDGFNLQYIDDTNETDISNLEYLIDLVADSKNKYNREELEEIHALLSN